MHLPEERIAAQAKRIGIGEHGVGGQGDILRVTLGSCIGLCLVWGKQSRFAVAHILLPSRSDSMREYPDSRFADTAIPFLLAKLGPVERNREVTAYVAGGGTMYASANETDAVGSNNTKNTMDALRQHRIRVVDTDLGGSTPRQLVVDGPGQQVISLNLDLQPTAAKWPMPPNFGPRKIA